MQRLDKILSDAGVASRKELRGLIRSGRVCANGCAATRPEEKFDEMTVELTLDGAPVEKLHTVLLMLHKPAGYVTSTDDPGGPSVLELIPERWRRFGVMPVGRLDKATEGLLLFTNDGVLAHRLISPRCGVWKRYYAEHEGTAAQADVCAFEAGMELTDGTRCLPARLTPLGAGRSMVEIREGKYHQVRRMLAARGLPVQYLRREAEGTLTLDGLERGEVRELPLDAVEELLNGEK